MIDTFDAWNLKINIKSKSSTHQMPKRAWNPRIDSQPPTQVTTQKAETEMKFFVKFPNQHLLMRAHTALKGWTQESWTRDIFRSF